MVQQFKHCSLHFSVSWLIIVKSLCTYCIDFINENNCWRFFLCQSKCVSDHLRTITNVHLNQTWPSQFQESGFCLSCTCSGHHGLSSTWRTEHKTSLWRSDTDVLEFIFVSNWQYDGFSQLFNLLIESTDISIFLRRSLFNLHRSDSWIIFGR